MFLQPQFFPGLLQWRVHVGTRGTCACDTVQEGTVLLNYSSHKQTGFRQTLFLGVYKGPNRESVNSLLFCFILVCFSFYFDVLWCSFFGYSTIYLLVQWKVLTNRCEHPCFFGSTLLCYVTDYYKYKKRGTSCLREWWQEKIILTKHRPPVTIRLWPKLKLSEARETPTLFSLPSTFSTFTQPHTASHSLTYPHIPSYLLTASHTLTQPHIVSHSIIQHHTHTQPHTASHLPPHRASHTHTHCHTASHTITPIHTLKSRNDIHPSMHPSRRARCGHKFHSLSSWKTTFFKSFILRNTQVRAV